MARTGPQRYPGASHAYRYSNRYPGSAMESNVIVWHSTEGTSLPSYGGGSMAPNFTAVPDFKAKRLVWYQHFDFDESSRALVNKSGGVQTNTANACQVEIVGTCDPSTHKKWAKAGYAHLYTPELPDWAIRDLGAFAKWAHDAHGVRLESGLTFKPYPSSYGNTNTRMTGAEWSKFYGHCGHQHVPENDHGDPGNMDINAILAAARGGSPEEVDPLAGYSKKDIYDSVMRTDAVPAPKSSPTKSTNKTWTLESYVQTILNTMDAMREELAALRKKVDSLESGK